MTVPDIQNLALTYQSTFGPAAAVCALDGTGAITTTLDNFPSGGCTIECWFNVSQSADGMVILSYDDTTAGKPNRLSIKTPGSLAIGFGPIRYRPACRSPTGSGIISP